MILAPSILNADFADLGETIKLIDQSNADWVHLDVMDGNFVPNISFGTPIVKDIRKLTAKPLDVHLMVLNPDAHIPDFRACGADVITVHYEVCSHLHRTIELIKSTGARAGVALNPHTPVEHIIDILEMLDLVLIMSVNPGFGGQKFIYQSIPKIKRLRSMIDTENASTLIEVDGGIGLHNAESVLQAGADVLVVGSAITQNNNPNQVINQLKAIPKHRQYIV